MKNGGGRHVQMTGKRFFIAAQTSRCCSFLVCFLTDISLSVDRNINNQLFVGGGEQMPRRDFNSRSVRERKDRYRRKR